MLCCHDNSNVGLHVCAKIHDHTYAVLYAHRKKCQIITKYGSTLYIEMDEVLAHYACTFENSDLHFHFQ